MTPGRAPPLGRSWTYNDLYHRLTHDIFPAALVCARGVVVPVGAAAKVVMLCTCSDIVYLAFVYPFYGALTRQRQTPTV